MSNLKKYGKFNEIKVNDKINCVEKKELRAIFKNKTGKLKNSELEIEKAILSNPTNPENYRYLGYIKKKLGKADEALSAYRKAVTLNNKDTASIYASGAIFQKHGNLIAAESCYKQCLLINPNIAEAHYNLGLIFKDQRKFSSAIICFKKALSINPYLSQAINNLGLLYYENGEINSAIKKFEEAIIYDPIYYLYYYNIGKIFQEIGCFNKAISYYLKSIFLNNKFYECYNNIGICFEKIGSSKRAIEYLIESIRKNPKNDNSYYNIGIIYHHNNSIKNAINFTKKAIIINNKNIKAYYTLFEQLREGCCWKELSELTKVIEELTLESIKKNIKPAESPSLSITRTDNLKINNKISKLWSNYIKNKINKNNSLKYDKKIPIEKNNKITIGYLSNRFRNAATGHLMQSMFSLHDKSKFEVHCYSWGPNDGSYYRKNIERSVNKFIDITNLSFQDAAELISKNNVDILIDLKGFTRNNRMEICALRPSPIQIAYMNFNGTSGANYYDYIIGDKIVIPKEHQCEYDEKIIYMPNSFLVTDKTQVITEEKYSRENLGISADVPLMCSFNQSYKIEYRLFKSWMKILKVIDNSVLWLLYCNDVATKNMLDIVKDMKINKNRIIFSKKVEKTAHLARLKLADLALDTWLVNGHTTTVDALFSDVPVITLLGKHFASRVSSSLLNSIGLDELISFSEKEYVDKSIKLFSSKEKLKNIRNKLIINKDSGTLFNTHLFVQNLEKAFIKIWKIYLEGKESRHIYV